VTPAARIPAKVSAGAACCSDFPRGSPPAALGQGACLLEEFHPASGSDGESPWSWLRSSHPVVGQSPGLRPGSIPAGLRFPVVAMGIASDRRLLALPVGGQQRCNPPAGWPMASSAARHSRLPQDSAADRAAGGLVADGQWPQAHHRGRCRRPRFRASSAASDRDGSSASQFEQLRQRWSSAMVLL